MPDSGTSRAAYMRDYRRKNPERFASYRRKAAAKRAREVLEQAIAIIDEKEAKPNER